MSNSNSVGRFIWHGSKFLWRVGAIFSGVVAAGAWEMLRSSSLTTDDATNPSPIISSYQEARMEFQAGRISLGELSSYEALFNDY